MYGKEVNALRQIQELLCLKDIAVSSDPRFAPQTAKKPFFLKDHLRRWLLSLDLKIVVDTSWHWVDTK